MFPTQNHCEKSQSHLYWIHEGDEGKDDDGGECIVGLIVDQVTHYTVSKLVHVLVFRNLESEMK